MSEDTWQSRRDKVRETYLSRLTPPTTADEPLMPPPTTGDAPPSDAVSVDLFERAVAPAWRSFVTSATDMVKGSGTRKSRPASTMPAASTSSSSDASTVWMVSPLGLVDSSSTPNIVDPSGSLVPGLPLNVQSSLLALATGRGEPIEAVVRQIAEWFVEAEDERAEGPLGDAVTFYVENYMNGGF